MLEALTRIVLRHRKLVLGVWLGGLVVSAVLASGLADLLTNRFSLPGTETARAEDVLEEHFGQKSTGSFTLVARTDGAARRIVPEVQEAAKRAAAELPTGRVVAVQPVSAHVVSAQVVSELDPAEAKGHTDDMREAAGEIPGAELYLTGAAAIERDLDPVFAEDLKVGELYIAIPAALLLLIAVFGTLAFVLPFVFAAAAIPVTLAIIWGFANFMELTTYLQNMVMLIGLAIAVDYSLLVVYRYRDELEGPGSREDAIMRTMQTAGRAVVFSGTAVAIGLALLLFMPLPFMRGFGIGGLLIPLISVICAVTLLPVLLYYVEGPLDRVRLVPRRRTDAEEGGFWSRLAWLIMRRPAPFAVATAAVLVAAALPVLDLELGPGSNAGIPRSLESMRGLTILTEAVGEGAVSPTEIVVDTGRAQGAEDPATRAAVTRLIALIDRDREAAGVRFGEGPQYVDPTGRYLHVQVIGLHEYGEPESMDFVRRLRDRIIPASGLAATADVATGGGPPSGVDFLHLTYKWFPWLVLAVLLATYVLLLRAFRSLLLPLKAIILNLLSIGAAYGLLVVVFKWGAGEWVGLTAYDQIEGWIPVMLFAMLFGLSMDYEVFLVSRMREEWDNGRSNEEAVALGLAKTGRLITAAGLIMFAAFMGFVAGSVVGLQQFGFGLAVAILVDVTIIRALLVPSAMKLFGRWNWWLPPNVARIFRVEPSPLVERRSAVPARGR